MPTEIKNAKQIADDLGGIPKLAAAIGVPYRRAYGYVEEFDHIPARHDPKLVAALAAAGSDIDQLSLALWHSRVEEERRKASLARNDSRCHAGSQPASGCKAQSVAKAPARGAA